jgi:serine/threonine protein kinase
MVIERLGPSLDELFGQCHFRFSLKTVLFLACQLVGKVFLCSYTWIDFRIQLRRLQYIHSRNYIHRDLKPSNIVMGVDKNVKLVYIIDFGLSKQYRDPDTRAHIPYSQGHGFTGTAHFASINSHLGLELGRRDDLESLAYVLIYFLNGSLPWKRQGKKILPMKQKFTSHKLYSRLPPELRIFLELSRSISFDSKPDYVRYYNLFHARLATEGFYGEPTFDWDVDHVPGQQ